MKKTIELTLIVFAISFLTSCTSNGIALPKTIPGTVKTYTVNQEGMVEILGHDIKTQPKHWIYVRCDHWSGCYMHCQGKISFCIRVARDSEFPVDYIVSP